MLNSIQEKFNLNGISNYKIIPKQNGIEIIDFQILMFYSIIQNSIQNS